MKKLTKIVATIGPSCESKKLITQLILNGVDVFRFNFKHANPLWHEQKINQVNQIAKKLGIYVGTLIDLQGPEIRVRLNQETLRVKKGEVYSFGKDISISYPKIISQLKGGEKVLIEDGYWEFEVIKKEGKIFLLSKQNGVIKDKKNFHIPGVKISLSSLVEKDVQALEIAARNEVDFVALSFVRNKNDIFILKKEMKKLGVKAKIIAKIETEEAIKNIDKIIEISDGIMVARGDLGVELPLEQVPYYQKMIIEKTLSQNKFVITATQMLQSMMTSRLPTRAEVSDVANACYDQTDAVMLSGETALGKYPLLAVKKMRDIILFNENKFLKPSYYFQKITDKEEIIAKSVVNLLNYHYEKNQKPEAIIVFTETGKTARFISANRPPVPIIAVVPEKKIADGLTVYYGIYPLIYKEEKGKQITPSSVKKVLKFIYRKFKIELKNVLVIHGDYWRVKGKISTLRFYPSN